MFNFICKSFPHLKHSLRTSPTQHELHYLQLNHLLISFSSKAAPKPTSENAKEDSFTVNYLIKTCGFAPEKAISASKYVNFNKPDKPDAVIAFLKNHGFSETQVLRVIGECPPIVLCNPKKIILPKFEFFLSYGFSKAGLSEILVAVPGYFRVSLDRKILPSLNWFEKLLGSSEKTVLAITRRPRLLSYFPRVVSNVELLQKAGVPEARIRNVLTYWSAALGNHPDKFKEIVEEVRKIGFDPSKPSFFTAVHVILGLSKSSWKRKMAVYKKWGCSEDEVLAAFETNPWCMSVSEDKIERIMGFLVNEMGWNPSMLMQGSLILSMSLNKRIIPRCSVYQVLVSKGFIKQRPSLRSVLSYSEVKFCKRCLECYEKEAPELLRLYQEQMKLPRGQGY